MAIDTYHKEQHHVGYNEMAGLLTELKHSDHYAWLKDVHSQVLQQALKDLETAYRNFFRKFKNGDLPKNDNGTFKKRKSGQLKASPRFKCKANFADSFRYPQGIKLDENYVWLPKIS